MKRLQIPGAIAILLFCGGTLSARNADTDLQQDREGKTAVQLRTIEAPAIL